MDRSKKYYRRHLPHYQPNDGIFHVVFRLAGSIPTKVIGQLRAEYTPKEKHLAGIRDRKERKDRWSAKEKYFENFDEILDSGINGPIWLKEKRIGSIVSEALHHGDGNEYSLFAFCIMPNHVHVVISLEGDADQTWFPVTKVFQKIKSFTALKANRILGRSGPFWQSESYDHFIRDNDELERTLWYVVNNPVKARLANSWKDFQWTYLKPGLLELDRV